SRVVLRRRFRATALDRTQHGFLDQVGDDHHYYTNQSVFHFSSKRPFRDRIHGSIVHHRSINN
ncbi:hypothetical protein, partial [Nitrosomonas ureae]|uniref:hypothetical protein n=1 Tax=Nitrosomonas ureae TaxID=44577 RepID=UPI001C42FB5E